MPWREKMEFDFEQVTLLVAAVFYLFILAFLWKFNMGGEGWDTKYKIIISIAMLPLCYFTTLWQMNK